ncbi:MAG: 5-formyltetrahydrofolate cyclo-ligase [Halioglobus sp.]
MEKAKEREAERKDLRTTVRKDLRKTLRERRNALNRAQQAQAALAIVDTVAALPQWQNAKRIALYSAFDGEISTLPLAEHARRCSKQVYLPIISSHEALMFGLWGDDAILDENNYGILQPGKSAEPHSIAAMDIVFMPLVGWDEAGNRLGMGGGYYDRALANQQDTLKVGLAHSCQQVPAIEPATWDIRMDYVVTNAGLHRCSVGH